MFRIFEKVAYVVVVEMIDRYEYVKRSTTNTHAHAYRSFFPLTETLI